MEIPHKKLRKTLFPILLLMAALSTQPAFAETNINKDKLKSAAYKTGKLILEIVVPGAGDILAKIDSIYQDLKEAFGQQRQTVTEAMRQNKMLGKPGAALEAFVHENAEIVDSTTFILNGAEENALVYFSLPGDKNGPLRDVLVEADVVVDKIADAKENNGFQTIAIGARGQKMAPYWSGYSFQLLSGGIMKVCDQADSSKLTCNQNHVGKVTAGNKYHMLLAIKGKSAYITLTDDMRRAKYKQQCDLSGLNMEQEGGYVYLYAWKTDVKFSNVKITAL